MTDNAIDTQPAYPLPVEEWRTIAAGQSLPILVNGDQLLIGITVFEPGEEFPNHLHTTLSETFIGVHGEVELWINRSARVTLAPGIIRSVPPDQEHYLRNESSLPATILYIKAPNNADDRVPTRWTADEHRFN